VGRIEVTFIINKYLHEIPTREFNTPRGATVYSSPEATAIDLVAYSSRCGGLSNVLTVLSELTEQIDIEALKQILATTKEYPTLQRLGYMFELLEEDALASAVSDRLGPGYLVTVPLDTRNPNRQGDIYKRWRLLINTELESDL
jgi:predicted transcriptional regulator of viral defense system